LQFAVSISLTGLAVFGVIVQKQFDYRAPEFADIRGVGAHNHSLRSRVTAGRDRIAHPVDFHQAHAARTLKVQTRMIAQPWNTDGQPFRRLHDSGPFRHGELVTVDGESDLVFRHRLTPKRYRP